MKKLIAILASSAAIHFALTVSALPINSPPTISPISDQTILKNSFLILPFTVDDPDPGDLAFLTIAGFSSNPVLLPVANLVFTGGGDNRTLTAFPVTDETGFTIITLTAFDPLSSFATTMFRLDVVDALPPIPGVPDSGSSLVFAGCAFASLMVCRRLATPPRA